jgi:hypothetical protein
MRPVLFLIVVGFISGVFSPAWAQSKFSCRPGERTDLLRVGSDDNFSPAADASSPIASPLLTTWNPSPNLASIDETGRDRTFLHSFDFSGLPQGSTITRAEFEIAVRPLTGVFNTGLGSDNDDIYLIFLDPSSNITNGWANSFGTFGAKIGLVTPPGVWNTTNISTRRIFTLDLAAMPPVSPSAAWFTTNLLAPLQADRVLHLSVQDDTTVDYAQITFCSIQVPPPTEHLSCLRTSGTILNVGSPGGGQPEARSHHCEDDEIVAFLDINRGTLDHGDKIHIRSYSKKFFQATTGGSLNANASSPSTPDTEFTIQKTTGTGTITPGSEVTLRGEFNKFISAVMGGGDILTADKTAASWWENFLYLPATETIYCIRTFDGQHFLSSVSDMMTVNSNPTLCQAWENQTIIDVNGGALESGDYVFVRSFHSRYWSAQPTGELEADRNAHGSWERFEIFKVNSPSTPIGIGDQFGLRGAHGKWLSADNAGGAAVRVNRAVRREWETFTLELP